MRTEIHPFSGMTYEELGEGRVRVTKDDRHGVFDWEGHWFEGKITHADPHFLQYVGGPNLPASQDTYAAMAARKAGQAADDSYNGALRDQRSATMRMMSTGANVTGKYVGDPGRDTPKGRRSTGISFQELLDGDSHPERIPPELRLDSPMTGGVTKVPTERYFAKKWHDLEVERLWKRVWQYAAMEQDIPEAGDYVVYDIAHLSYLIVRVDATTIKAYHNACLHRGRQLRDWLPGVWRRRAVTHSSLRGGISSPKLRAIVRSCASAAGTALRGPPPSLLPICV